LPPEQERYPLRLANHAAFHTPLQQPIAVRGQELLDQSLFRRPDLPLIDGRGKIWTPFASDPAALRDYTLSQQVVTPYDFTRAIQVGVKEFAPEALIILGPGTTLGGATAQALIAIGWQGLTSKADFIARQKDDPAILTMGMAEQRSRVVASL
jgi:acyl transferase domain-containing protein